MEFSLQNVNATSGEPASDEKGLHINPLEYIAAIINLYLFLFIISQQNRIHPGPPV
jgi:hypothetical protein